MNQQIWEFFASRSQIEGKPVKLSNGFESSVYQDIEALIANTNCKLIPFDDKNKEFCKGHKTLCSTDFLLIKSDKNDQCREFIFIELKDFNNIDQSVVTMNNIELAIEKFTELTKTEDSAKNQALKKITHSALVAMALLQDCHTPIKDIILSNSTVSFSFYFIINIDDLRASDLFFGVTQYEIEVFKDFTAKLYPFIKRDKLAFLTKDKLIEKLQNQIK